MIIRRTIGLVLSALLITSATACTTRTDEDALVGRWVQSAEIVDGSEVSIPDDNAPTIEFREDGTADYLDGEVDWSIDGDDTISLTLGDASSLQTHLTVGYTLSGDRLVIDNDTVYERE